MTLYQDGQKLFKLPVTEFPDIALTRKEVQTCDGVFGVYTDVSSSIDGWKELQWSQVRLCVCTRVKLSWRTCGFLCAQGRWWCGARVRAWAGAWVCAFGHTSRSFP